MVARFLLLVVGVSVALGWPGPALAAPGGTRGRARLIRGGLLVHRYLRRNNTTVQMPPSTILSAKTAAAKRYGDSWTCRESSKALATALGSRSGCEVKLASSGKNTFKWGNEGWVSYHYYLVDNARRPTVLLDPTATSNFAVDAQPGGMLHTLLGQVGRELGMQKAANRVLHKVARGTHNGLLILANSAEITVYREVLERAAKVHQQASRTAETRK